MTGRMSLGSRLTSATSARSGIIAFSCFLLCIKRYLPERQGAALISSQAATARLLADLVERFDFEVVRGSSSRKGASAIRQLAEVIANGRDVVITPDGPRGPAYELGQGIVFLAQQSGAEVVPINMEYSSSWRVQSWDRFILPRPFSTVRVIFGRPHRVRPPRPTKNSSANGSVCRRPCCSLWRCVSSVVLPAVSSRAPKLWDEGPHSYSSRFLRTCISFATASSLRVRRIRMIKQNDRDPARICGCSNHHYKTLTLADPHKLIDGRAVAEKVYAELRGEIALLKANGTTPGLAVVLVGDDPASRAYVRSKDKMCRSSGCIR